MKIVRICLSNAIFCLAIAWGDSLLFSFHVIPPVEPYRSIGAISFVGGHLVAFVLVIIASISGISTIVRHREDCSTKDFSFVTAAIVACAFFSYLFFRPIVVY